MFRSKTDPQPQLRLRGKDGKPYYLKKLPFYKRNPVRFVAVSGFATFLILYSKPLYDVFLRKDDDNPHAGWWPHEIAAGKRQVDVWREKLEKEKAEREAGVSYWSQLLGGVPENPKPIETPASNPAK